MNHSRNPIQEILERDPRYRLEAYQFVREGLTYAQEIKKMGSNQPSSDGEEVEKHLSGQQLCEAIREYALEQYGFMATVVLKNWGVTKTRDFGNIVYNLIDGDLMKKSQNDRVEDFDDVFVFDVAFQEGFKIEPEPDESGKSGESGKSK